MYRRDAVVRAKTPIPNDWSMMLQIIKEVIMKYIGSCSIQMHSIPAHMFPEYYFSRSVIHYSVIIDENKSILLAFLLQDTVQFPPINLEIGRTSG